MMSATAERLDRLYQLLPVVHRTRDYELGEPLRALLQVIAEQVNVVEDDIGRLYENWFIETCEDWVVPYIADLIGYEPVHEAGEPSDVTTEEERNRNKVLIPRREVANTIRYRRRKGTLALLELLAQDVAGWPARAVEFYRLLAATQSLAHLQPRRGRTVDLRAGEALDRLDGPFDELAHTVEVRRIISRHDQGRYNISSVGLFVWRLKAYSVTHAPAYCLEKAGPHCYTFSALGNDAPLFVRPEEQPDASTIAGETNVPAPIRRRAFEQPVLLDGQVRKRASPAYYGLLPDGVTGSSLAIWADDWPDQGADVKIPILPERIIPADLSGWSYVAPRDHVAVDPVLGRIAFPPKQLPKKRVWVSYHYGFSADMGGGEYKRPLSEPEGAELRRVIGQDELRRELELWRQKDGGAHPDQPRHAVIEIGDSGVYVLPINLFLGKGNSLQIRAAERARPVIRLLDWQTDQPDGLTVTGECDSHFTLDGVMVAGRGVQIQGDLASFTVRHSTLVPGWSLEPNCDPRRPAEPSIEVINSGACIVIEHSIVGSIQVNNNEVMTDPVSIRVSDSIIDATGSECDGPECEAIGAVGSDRAHAVLRIARSTVIGRVMIHAIELAENSIFMSCVTVARRQIGCMRFCYVRHGSRTPRRFECQPDLAERAVEEALIEHARLANEPPPARSDIEAAYPDARRRVKPLFNGLRYGLPTYCQLALACPPEIVRGADDESEMGAFHDLYQPQRAANLRARLDEYSPAAADAGLIFAN